MCIQLKINYFAIFCNRILLQVRPQKGNFRGDKMIYINDEHKQFYENKCKEILKYRELISNYKAFIYTIGICRDTRNNFKQIYNIQKDRFDIEIFKSAWQTTGSMKVCRLAFNLLNGFCYDSDEDIEADKVSLQYTVAEIFACGFAPYFIQAIALRYPSYMKEDVNNDYKSNI